MKTLLTFFLAFTSLSLYSQNLPIDNKTGKVTYEEVVTVEGTYAEGIYIRANEWFAKTFNSAQDVIQMQDKEAGRIIGKGSISVTLMKYQQGFFEFTISFYAKDGRYKYIITDINHSNPGGSSGGNIINEKPECGTFYMTKKQWIKLKIQAEEKISSMASNLKQFISEDENSEDEW